MRIHPSSTPSSAANKQSSGHRTANNAINMSHLLFIAGSVVVVAASTVRGIRIECGPFCQLVGSWVQQLIKKWTGKVSPATRSLDLKCGWLVANYDWLWERGERGSYEPIMNKTNGWMDWLEWNNLTTPVPVWEVPLFLSHFTCLIWIADKNNSISRGNYWFV